MASKLTTKTETPPARAADDSKLIDLGSGPGYKWRVNASHVDMAMPESTPVPLTIQAESQRVTMDLRRTAILVIDMQNDFCEKGGWVDHLGFDYSADRAPINCATSARADSMTARARRPSACTEDGLPTSAMAATIASRASARSGAVAL